MNKEFSFREYADFDVGEIYATVRHVYLTSPFMSDHFDRKFPALPDFNKHYSRILKNIGSFLLVAMYHQKPVGYLVVESNPAEKLKHTAELNMGVIESFRSIGIGRYLLNQALDKVKAGGFVEIIYLMVRADHNSAIQLYEHAGFDTLATLGKDTKIGDEYFDGLLMRKFV